MSKTIQKAPLWLLVLPILAVLLSAGLFLPDVIFSLQDGMENDRIIQEQVDAVNLTLTEEMNLYKRMQMLPLENNVVTLQNNRAKSDEGDIATAAFLFMDSIYWHAYHDMPDTFSTEYVEAQLHTNTELQQSAVFWECCYSIKEDNLILHLILDDETGSVVGVYLMDLEPEKEYVSNIASFAYGIQEALSSSIGADVPVWIENRDERVYTEDWDNRWNYYYDQATLHIRDEKQQYQYIMAIAPDTVAFNVPVCAEIKAQYSKVEADMDALEVEFS